MKAIVCTKYGPPEVLKLMVDQSPSGRIDYSIPPKRVFRNLDMKRTIWKNLPYWDPKEKKLYINHLYYEHSVKKKNPKHLVIVVDQSSPFEKEFYNQFNLDLKLIRQEERALWLARNEAIKSSKAEFVLLFDDDSRVEPDWISNHIKCLDFFNASI